MTISSVEENLLLIRNLKNVDFYKLENNIFNNNKYLDTLTEKDTNVIAENIINIILEEYNKLAPLKKIKIKNDETDIKSKATKILIEKKDSFYKDVYVKDKNPLNKILLKNMQKVIRMEIYKDNNRSKQKKIIVVMVILIKSGNKQKIYFSNKNQIFQINSSLIIQFTMEVRK